MTERWNAFAHIRQDLFGFIDIVVLDGLGGGPLGVQVTVTDSMASRRAKIAEEPRARLWLDSPARIEIWGWAKRGAKGKRKLWELKREVVA